MKNPPVKDSLNGSPFNGELFRKNTIQENLKGLGGCNNKKRVESSPSRIIRDGAAKK